MPTKSYLYPSWVFVFYLYLYFLTYVDNMSELNRLCSLHDIFDMSKASTFSFLLIASTFLSSLYSIIYTVISLIILLIFLLYIVSISSGGSIGTMSTVVNVHPMIFEKLMGLSQSRVHYLLTNKSVGGGITSSSTSEDIKRAKEEKELKESLKGRVLGVRSKLIGKGCEVDIQVMVDGGKGGTSSSTTSDATVRSFTLIGIGGMKIDRGLFS